MGVINFREDGDTEDAVEPEVEMTGGVRIENSTRVETIKELKNNNIVLQQDGIAAELLHSSELLT